VARRRDWDKEGRLRRLRLRGGVRANSGTAGEPAPPRKASQAPLWLETKEHLQKQFDSVFAEFASLAPRAKADRLAEFQARIVAIGDRQISEFSPWQKKRFGQLVKSAIRGQTTRLSGQARQALRKVDPTDARLPERRPTLKEKVAAMTRHPDRLKIEVAARYGTVYVGWDDHGVSEHWIVQVRKGRHVVAKVPLDKDCLATEIPKLPTGRYRVVVSGVADERVVSQGIRPVTVDDGAGLVS
jgi:hypothetical protein